MLQLQPGNAGAHWPGVRFLLGLSFAATEDSNSRARLSLAPVRGVAFFNLLHARRQPLCRLGLFWHYRLDQHFSAILSDRGSRMRPGRANSGRWAAARCDPFFIPIALQNTWISSRLRSVKLAPAVRIDRVGHDFARGWCYELNAGRTFLTVFWSFLIFGCFMGHFGLSQGTTSRRCT